MITGKGDKGIQICTKYGGKKLKRTENLPDFLFERCNRVVIVGIHRSCEVVDSTVTPFDEPLTAEKNWRFSFFVFTSIFILIVRICPG
jgi:hypothetical protein